MNRQYEDIGYFWTQIQNEVFLQLIVLLQHKEISTYMMYEQGEEWRFLGHF